MKIKMLVLDVDSTLTDGKYYVNECGNITKCFFTRDFSALEELHNKGVVIIVVTNSIDNVIDEKIKTLPYTIYLIKGAVNKEQEIDSFILTSEVITWDNIAYIGDAENDIECVEKAGFSCCPNDAIPEIKEKVDFVSTYNGGNGAVWEFAKEILKINKLKGDINE